MLDSRYDIQDLYFHAKHSYSFLLSLPLFVSLSPHRFYLVSGGVPLIICGVTAAVNIDNYGSGEQAP